MKPLSKREHREIYQATGIDIDDRFEDIRGAVEFFERRVRELIGFSKAIPGFSQLDIEDQTALIKSENCLFVCLHILEIDVTFDTI